MIGWPSETVAPTEIINRTRSPESMFSPSSGSLNSLDTLEASPALRRSIRGGAADSCFAGEVAAELRSTWTGGTSVATRAESGFADFPTAGTTADACSTFFPFSKPGLVAAASLPFSTVKMTCPHAQLVALFYAHFSDRARHGRRHFDNSFVGLEFHHRFAFGDAAAAA